MEVLTEKLLNDFQRNFPLIPMPFTRIARALNTTTEAVLARLKELQEKGAVSRVGPVFRHNTIGVSTLAAMAVPADRLEHVATLVNSFSEVNHNYEREHRYNLWFVVTAEDAEALSASLADIEAQSGYPVLYLPLVKDYHIDLGFPMQLHGHQDSDNRLVDGFAAADPEMQTISAGGAEDLIEAIQGGLPLVVRPYQEIGNRLGWSEQAVIDRLGGMIQTGIIKRLGVVVRHHELGYCANAMVVWNVPDAEVDRIGNQLGHQDCVTLCYQRPRRKPDWPYNLFCMVHGKDRGDVLACIERMVEGLDLNRVDHSVLFSGRRFKQRGARYRRRN